MMDKKIKMLQSLEAMKNAKEKQALNILRAKEDKLRSILNELNEEAMRNVRDAFQNWSFQATPSNAMWNIWADAKRKSLNTELAKVRAQVLQQAKVQLIANARANALEDIHQKLTKEQARQMLAKSQAIDINTFPFAD